MERIFAGCGNCRTVFRARICDCGHSFLREGERLDESGVFMRPVGDVLLIYHQPYAFKINLACWEEEYLNGNIIFVTWLSAFLCGLALFVVGIVKRGEKRKKPSENNN